MKKTYISPNTLLYTVIVERTLLAGSGEKGTSVKDTNARQIMTFSLVAISTSGTTRKTRNNKASL